MSIQAAVATTLAVAAAVEIALFAVLAGTDTREWLSLATGNVLTTAAIAVPFAAVGALVTSRDRRHVLGWIFVALGQLTATATLSAVWADRGLALHGLAVALAAYLWVPALLLAISTLTLYFPDGRLPSRRWRPLAWLAWSVTGVGAVAQLFIAPPLETADPTVHSPLTIQNFDPSASTAILTGLTLLAVCCFLAGFTGLLVRAIRGQRERRAPLLWMLGAFAVMLVGGQLGPIPNLIGALAMPLGLGVATLRYGLYDGDRWRGRTAIHAIATVVVVVAVAVPVGTVAARLAGSEVGAVLAAVVIGLGFAPAQQLARRGIDRLFYGDRMQPYVALSRLGQRLENTLSQDEVLPALVTTVSRSLHLPYAAVTLAGDETPAAHVGERTENLESVALTHGGDRVGTLEVGIRAGQRVLDAGDDALLRDLAAQAGASVGAVLLNRDLVRSRGRLVVAREEERRRIRMDLHDGLGPTLAGVALRVDAAHRAAGRAGVSEMLRLDAIHADVQHGLDDLKLLVASLRPAALDDIGLVATLQDYASGLTASGRIRVSVECGDPLPPLPAAVEVAAYFVAREAMNNAVRHSRGRNCLVRLRYADALEVDVTDDGLGIATTSLIEASARSPWQADRDQKATSSGVGLGSMTDRARELGGDCSIESIPSGGTRVHARLPVRA
jgi:signal transduction histidine kinase